MNEYLGPGVKNMCRLINNTDPRFTINCVIKVAKTAQYNE